MLNSGGVKTNYHDKPIVEDIATGKEVLSESQGLLMRYSASILDRQSFDLAYDFTKDNLDNGKIFVYRFNPDSEKKYTVNAAVDDLRIIKALYEAGEAFSDKSLTREGDKYSKRFYKTNVADETLYDFYDTSQYMKNNFITLCYLDLEALKLMSERDKRYLDVYDNSVEILEGGYISDEFPMFMTKFDYKIKEYEAANDINMIEAVLTAYNLSVAGKCPDTTVKFLKESLDKGRIYSKYDVSGIPKTKNESTAVYALTAMLAQNIGDNDMYSKSITLMNRFMVKDKNSALYGAFGDKKNIYSFDNLMAISAYREGVADSVDGEVVQ